MTSRVLWSRILIVIGSVAMLVGAIDPLEGSLIILPGAGMVALGTFIQNAPPTEIRYWLWVFALIAVGVGALFALSAGGGIGGKNGRSIWWGLTIVPYIIGWILGFIGIIRKIVAFLKRKRQNALA